MGARATAVRLSTRLREKLFQAAVLTRYSPVKRALAWGVRTSLRHVLRVDAERVAERLDPFVNRDVWWLRELGSRPLLSVLLPVYDPDPAVLQRCIESVCQQYYRCWELCIVDDRGRNPEVADLLRTYADRDPRIRLRSLELNQGGAVATNVALEMAGGDFVGVLDHDDVLEASALLEYVRVLYFHSEVDLIYCDEDKIDPSGKRCHPWHKSGWNPDLALSINYVMHFAMYRRSLVERLGGFRSLYEGSHDYDLLLRVCEATDRIAHLPRILYHWRMGTGSIAAGPNAKPYVFESGRSALQAALDRRGIAGTVEDAPDAWKGVYRVRRALTAGNKVSLIIAANGDIESLSRLLESIREHAPPEAEDIVISAPADHAEEIRTLLTEREVRGHIVEHEKSISLPGIFNRATRFASCELLLFLDERMELESPESIRALLEHAQRDEVGATGAKILHGGSIVEHCGIMFGPFGVLGYANRATPDDPCYLGFNNMIKNYSAVMGLGMMLRKDRFENVGGFDESFERAYWDADLCLRLGREGQLITFTPYARFVHHLPVKSLEEWVVEPEASLLRQRWPEVIERDPYFSPHFSRAMENFSIREQPPSERDLAARVLPRRS